MFPGYGSTITAAISPGLASNARSTAGDVVERQHDRVARRSRRDAGRVGRAVRQRARAGRDQKRVGVPVIAAGELDDLRAAGEAARQTRGAHRRLGSARHEAKPLDRRHHRGDQLRELALELGRRPERRPAHCRVGDRARHGGMRVAEQQCAPRHHVVEILVAVEIVQHRARAALHEDRRQPDGTERAHRRVHAARDDVARAREGRDRTLQLHAVRSALARSLGTIDVVEILGLDRHEARAQHARRDRASQSCRLCRAPESSRTTAARSYSAASGSMRSS